MAEGRGVPVSELLRGTGLPAETLHDHRQRISWDDWAALVERTQFLLGGPGVLEDAATEITQLSWNRALSSLGRIAWTEVQFLRLVATRIAPAAPSSSSSPAAPSPTPPTPSARTASRSWRAPCAPWGWSYDAPLTDGIAHRWRPSPRVGLQPDRARTTVSRRPGFSLATTQPRRPAL